MGYDIKMPYNNIYIFNANSVDPDQTPRSLASDLVLHYLQMPLLWDARHKWVNVIKKKQIPAHCYVCLLAIIIING